MKLKKSSLLTKVIVLIVIVYATVTLVRLQSQTSQRRAEAAQIAAQVAELEQENADLQSSIDHLESEEGIIEVARDKLGMVSDGEIIFYDQGE